MPDDELACARRRGPFPPSASPNEERLYGTRKSPRWEIAELTASLCSRSGSGAGALQVLWPGSTFSRPISTSPGRCRSRSRNWRGGSAVARLTRAATVSPAPASWLVPASCQRVRPFFKARHGQASTPGRDAHAAPNTMCAGLLVRRPWHTPCGSPIVAVPRRTHLAANHPGRITGTSVRPVTGDAAALALA